VVRTQVMLNPLCGRWETGNADMDNQEPGVLFLATGLLITGYAVLAAKNRVPMIFWGLGFVVGPIFLLIGGNSIYRGMRG